MKRKVTNVHYTIETRKCIETLLNESYTITEISREIKRDRSNIAKEINKHKILYYSEYGKFHPCVNHSTCEAKSYECYKYCKKIEINLCEKLTSSPHVCNGCSKKRTCKLAKYYYKPNEADLEYQKDLSEKRLGLRYNEIELNIINNDLKALILVNQSLHHSLVVINNRGYNFNKRTIYKQIEKGQLDIKSEDLLRPRKKKNEKQALDKSYKKSFMVDHTYEDYIKFKEIHVKAIEMQMDTVEGVKLPGEPVLLTLQIVEISFIFIFKLPSNQAQEVMEKLVKFKNTIGSEYFDYITEILLTDNGSEFSDLRSFIENFPNTNLFYCHPYSSYEKGSIENNHEFIRRVIPKGVSLKLYTQSDLNILTSHINSTIRSELNDKCPFDLIENYIPKDKLKKLELKKIKPEDVILIPRLLKDKNIDNIKKHLDYKEIKKRNIKLYN